MAVKKKAAAKIQPQEEEKHLDAETKRREKCLSEVRKAGYKADWDGSILMIHLKKAYYDDSEIRDKAKQTILDTGYNASYGVRPDA